MFTLSGCDPDLNVEVELPRLQVQVQFLNYHEGVQGTWQGSLVTPSAAISPGLAELLDSVRQAGAQLPYENRVLANQSLNFPASSAPLYPGMWNIHFTVTDSAGAIMDFSCDANIPFVLGPPPHVVGLRIIEGQQSCTVAGVGDPFTPPERHDVQAVTLTTPATANVGDPVQAIVTISNHGNVPESVVPVTLTARPPTGAPITVGTRTESLLLGETKQVTFDWDTACIAAGNYTLSATVSVSNDDDMSNNTSPPASLAFGVDRELSISFVNAPKAPVPAGQGLGLIVYLENNDSVPEMGIDVSFTDTPASGPQGPVQRDPRLPVDLACGERKELIFTWFPPSIGAADHDLTVSIMNSIPGDSQPNNTDIINVRVQ